MPELDRAISTATRAPSSAPVDDGRRGAVRARTRRAATGSRPTAAPGTRACVVIATGHCDVPAVPAMARRSAGGDPPGHAVALPQPRELPEGGVLVVGASASGVQLAEEIQQSGRPVTLAVGRHTRLPRRYRGRDIMWWLDRAGVLDETAEAVRGSGARPGRSRRCSSSAGPTVTTSTSARCATSACAWSGRAVGIRTAAMLRLADDLAGDRCRRAARARAPARAHRRRRPMPMGAPRRGLAAPPLAFDASAGQRSICGRRHPHGRLGHRLPARLRLAARAGARRGGRDQPPRRRHAVPGTLRARPALPAAPALELHRRRRAPMPTRLPPTSHATSPQQRPRRGLNNGRSDMHADRIATMPWSSAPAAPAPPRRC